MTGRAVLMAACCAVVILWSDVSMADRKSPLMFGGAYLQRHPAYQPNSPDYHVDVPSVRPHVAYGQYPWYGSAWGMPTYNWGSIGANTYPDARCHKGYYRDFFQWNVWRRY